MDFSPLHTYTPPQSVPENTGYTYGLSSSYSSDALDFETEHKLDPVFDFPRLSRRSLHSVPTAYFNDNQMEYTRPYTRSASHKDRASKTTEHRNRNKQLSTVKHTARKAASNSSSLLSQRSFDSHTSDTSLRSSVLDESLIRKKTKVVHFWGLDDDGDLKGGTKTVQENGDLATEETDTALNNGYICSDCSMLSERKDVLTTYSTSHVPSSRIYFRDGSQKRKAASGVFWWLGTGWYQFVTLISWLNVFLLTRCLPKICKLLLLLIPLLLLLGIGLYLWNMESFLSFLPIFNWTRTQKIDESKYFFKPDYSNVNQPTKMDFMTFQQENEFRILKLEELLGKLSVKDKLIQEELDQTKSRINSGVEEQQHLLSRVKHLELELGHLKSELLTWQGLKTSCEKIETMHEKVDTQIRETIQLMFSDDQQGDSHEWLLQWISSKFVSKGDLQILLRDLELQILKNITVHMSRTKQIPTSETLINTDSMRISGITEAQARIIVNNALKLYSQDKMGMVDFALESGGGSILSTRCSETYETKTALISIFGIPLWYHSQSPRIVIQPDIYPGNCWAFKGSQGYLVVRLSMMIYPTAFTIEHIPKTLSPTGNISSAPKEFSVYGLDNEYQEEGMLLGEFVYDQGGESLQIFQAMKSPEKAFQIVELRIFSNWGRPEYTCLYRFRVHGELLK
ncbi:SUN domain-containing protein 1 isoform X10 [Macrotis lagotis]|uniref:SUN domain-containing protein 1 isoform X10 n=1 Tax=Macrotis lagotis TaxID=92651 RepID=UPI003D696282